MSDIQSNEPSSTEPTSVITQIFQGMHNLEQQVEHLIHPDAEAGSAAPGEALPTGTPADSGTNPGSSGPVSTESEAGNTAIADAAVTAAHTGTPGVLGNVDAAVMGAATELLSDASTALETSVSADLPRESHLLLLEHKLVAMHAKFMTGERIVIDEFEQILGHIRAVL